jgi:tRNA nucleotidyltransferase (CCA-adding enzyme)
MTANLLVTKANAIKNEILNGKLPELKHVRAMLRQNAYVSCREKVLEAYIIGSVAKGTSHKDSDLDIAIVIQAKARKSSLKFTEHYHAKFTCGSQKKKWAGLTVDFQFFYPNSQELASYTRIKL